MTLRRKPDEPIKVVICDDQPEVRRALRRHFERDGRIVVAAEADDGDRVVDVSLAVQPEVVVLDLAMPHVDGLLAIKQLVAVSPETKIVILSSMVPFFDVAHDAENQGAHAVFSKYVKPKRLIEAIVDLVRSQSEEAAA